MALEAAIVAFGRESEAVESSGCLEEVAGCLRELHKAMKDIYDYCWDLPDQQDAPEELAMLARVIAAWQLEDPRQFSGEFQNALPVLCRLGPAEFEVLLPCIQEMQDWHLTPALGKVLEIALVTSGAGMAGGSVDAWQQSALMLTEVALDAAAYLPEAPLGQAPSLLKASHQQTEMHKGAAAGLRVVSQPPRLPMPRPVQAAEAGDLGVQKLVAWSSGLWEAGAGHATGEMRWELGILCGALLVSVPE